MADPIAVIDQDQHIPASHRFTPPDTDRSAMAYPPMDRQLTSEGGQPLVQPLPLRESIEEMLRPHAESYARDTEDHRQNVAQIYAASSGSTKEENGRLRRMIKVLMDDRDYIEDVIKDRDSVFRREKSNFRRQRDGFLVKNRRLQREVDRLKEQILQSIDSNPSHLGDAFDVQRAVSAYQRQIDQQQASHNRMMESAHREEARLKTKIEEQAAQIRTQQRQLDEYGREFANLANYLEKAQELNAETAFERITQVADIMNPNTPPLPSDRPMPLPKSSITSEGRVDQRLDQLLRDDQSDVSAQSFGSYMVNQTAEDHPSENGEHQSAEQCMTSPQSDEETNLSEGEDFGTRLFSDNAIQRSHELSDEQPSEAAAALDSNPSRSLDDTVLLQPDVFNPNESTQQNPVSFQTRRPEVPRTADGFWQFHDQLDRVGGFTDLRTSTPSIQQAPVSSSSSSSLILVASNPQVQQSQQPGLSSSSANLFLQNSLPPGRQAPQSSSSSSLANLVTQLTPVQQASNASSSSDLANLVASLPPVQQGRLQSLSSNSGIRAAERWSSLPLPGATTVIDQSLNSSMTSTTTQNDSQGPNATPLQFSDNDIGDNTASANATGMSRNRSGSPALRQTNRAVAPILTNFGPASNPTISPVLSPVSGTITDATDGSVGYRIDRAIEHVATYGVVDVGDVGDVDTTEDFGHHTDQSSTYNLQAATTGGAAAYRSLAARTRRDIESRPVAGNVITQVLSSNSDVETMPQMNTDDNNNTHGTPHTEDHQDDIRASDPTTYSIQIGYDPRAPTIYAPSPNGSTPPVQPANTRRHGQWISVLVIDNEDAIMEQERRRIALTPNSASQLLSATPADDTMILDTNRLGSTARRELDEWGQRHLFSSGQIYGLLGLDTDTHHQNDAQNLQEVQQADIQPGVTDVNNNIQTVTHDVPNVSDPAITSSVGRDDQQPEQETSIGSATDLTLPTRTTGFENRHQPLGGDSRLRARYQRPGQRRSNLASFDIFSLTGQPRIGIEDQPLGQGTPALSTRESTDDSVPAFLLHEAAADTTQVEFTRSIFTRQLSPIWAKICIFFNWLFTYLEPIVRYPVSIVATAYQSTIWLIHILHTTPYNGLTPIFTTIISVLFDQINLTMQGRISQLKKAISWSFLYSILALYTIYVLYGASRARDEWFTANTSTMRNEILAYREDHWEWRVLTYLRWYLQLAVERPGSGGGWVMLT